MLQSQDGEFIEKFYEYMKSHMTEAEIDIDEILDIFSISRSKFYYKVKDLTGLSPNAFFRTYKLNKAAEMIKNSDEKLTYIADITGFCSQAYFTASFKNNLVARQVNIVRPTGFNNFKVKMGNSSLSLLFVIQDYEDNTLHHLTEIIDSIKDILGIE